MKAALAASLLVVAACADDPPPKDDFSIYKCKEASTNLPNGNHNPGMDCQGACHDHGFAVAGTVFTDSTGSMPAVGANVTIRDADLKIYNMITASNGNFYMMDKPKYPVRAWVSSCPDVELMPDFIDKNELITTPGSCNQGICHNNAAGTGVITLFQ